MNLIQIKNKIKVQKIFTIYLFISRFIFIKKYAFTKNMTYLTTRNKSNILNNIYKTKNKKNIIIK